MATKTGLCGADVESLRCAQCEDDEIAVHLEMHAEGRCPIASETDRVVYGRRVRLRRGDYR